MTTLIRIARTAIATLFVLVALLTFPQFLPLMVGGWLVAFTWFVGRKQRGWIPLAASALILLAKGVPLVPSIVALVVSLLLVAGVRWKLKEPGAWNERSSWLSLLVVWCSWIYFCLEWHWIGQCNHSVQFDSRRPVVCIGDSLTSGLIPDPGYPGALKELLSVPVINLGQSGIASHTGLERMSVVLSNNPQILVIELGGHDFLKGYQRAETKRNILAMIAQCREKDCEVVLAEIPRGFIFDPFRGLEREIAFEQDVPLIPDGMIRQLVIWSPVCPPGMWVPGSRLSDDGIHSNPLGSQKMAKRVADVLERMVGPEILAPK